MRVRTIRLPDDRYAHVYVVREPGERGGHTVMGEIHHKAPRSGNVEPDSQPEYKIKPGGRKHATAVKKAVTRRGRG